MLLSSKYYKQITVCSPSTGILENVDGDGVPTVAIYKNNVIDDMTLTVTKVSTGVYKIVSTNSFIDEGFVEGDKVEVFATANMTEAYTSIIDSFEIKTISESVHIWHVAQTGSDSYLGHSFDGAKLTIGGALNEATAGDTIIVHPGTYIEEVGGSGINNITLMGCGFGSIITSSHDSTATLTLGNGWVVKNIQIAHTGTPTSYTIQKCIAATQKSNIIIENCYISAVARGIILGGCNNVTIYSTAIDSSEYGILSTNAFGAISSTIIDKCHIKNLNWPICHSSALFLSGGDVIVKDSILGVNTAVADIEHISRGIEINSSSSGKTRVTIDNVGVYVSTGNDSYERGVEIAGAIENVHVLANKMHICTTGTTENSYDILHTRGVLVVGNSKYDTTKVSGTIIQGGSGNEAAIKTQAANAITDAAIPAGVRINLSTELAHIDANISSRNAIAPDNTNIGNIHNIVKSGGTGDCAAIKTQTDKMEFITGYRVTGTLSPNMIGDYFYAGTYNGQPYYARTDSVYKLFYSIATSKWTIGANFTDIANRFVANSGIVGTYASSFPASGTATVTAIYSVLSKLDAQSKADVNAECDTALIDYGANKIAPATPTNVSDAQMAIINAMPDLDSLNDISANDVVNALFAATGITVGGTYTFAKLLQVLAAWAMGNARAKEGVTGTTEILDAEDGTTVVAEVVISTQSPYREITIL